MMIPYRVDVPMDRWPIANWVLIGFTVVAFFFSIGPIIDGELPTLALGSGHAVGWIGHMFVHGGFIHLFGNMLFLWLFGNAICAKIGNVLFIFIYLGLGLAAAVAHTLFEGGPAIGASGAINGIVGMYLIWYPLNPISCFYMIFLTPAFFTVSSMWMIMLWFAFDLLGLALGGTGVGYMAHIGGFLAGATLGVVLLLTGTVKMERWERSLSGQCSASDRNESRVNSSEAVGDVE